MDAFDDLEKDKGDVHEREIHMKENSVFIISCVSFLVDQVTRRTLLFDHVCGIP